MFAALNALFVRHPLPIASDRAMLLGAV